RDTEVMIDSLARLGIQLVHDRAASTVKIDGCRGVIPATTAELWLENSGTSIRFAVALCCLGKGTYRLDGHARMRERPIGELTAALTTLGGGARCEKGNGCPPVIVSGSGSLGGLVQVGGEISSQFLSALLMVAPAAEKSVSIDLEGTLVSQPYVTM